jgi:hypothetical protein
LDDLVVRNFELFISFQKSGIALARQCECIFDACTIQVLALALRCHSTSSALRMMKPVMRYALKVSSKTQIQGRNWIVGAVQQPQHTDSGTRPRLPQTVSIGGIAGSATTQSGCMNQKCRTTDNKMTPITDHHATAANCIEKPGAV